MKAPAGQQLLAASFCWLCGYLGAASWVYDPAQAVRFAARVAHGARHGQKSVGHTIPLPRRRPQLPFIEHGNGSRFHAAGGPPPPIVPAFDARSRWPGLTREFSTC